LCIALRLFQDSNMAAKGRTVKKLEREELFQYAAALLAARSQSAGEVRVKLARKAADTADIDPVLARLRECGFLDDSRFAEGFATARRDSGAFGASRVLRDLRQRRVAGTVAEKAVGEAFREVDEADAIAAWLERKLRGKNKAEFLADRKNLASTYRKLVYAGFRGGTAIRVLRQFSASADELDEDAAVDT
jgi:SOS response regulatory protein OraA/RecX